ncbi:cyclase family protein [Streptomyces sp. NPDC059373]
MSTENLRFYNLSHTLGHNMVQWPSPFSAPLVVNRLYYHSMHDFFTVEYDGIMHRGTHMDAPVHVTADQPYLDSYELWRFFGTGVAVSIPKGKWGVITPEDLENATPAIQPNDIVMINTGAHHHFGDNDTYYSYSPGLYTEAAQWLVDRQVKLVGVDVQALDHPLGTRMVEHGPGPILPHLIDEYRAETGRDVHEDFPDWEPAHKTMLLNGVPGIENVGGELDAVTGRRCTFMAFPTRIKEGDGSPIRIVAVVDPDQRFRIPTGV